MAFWEVGGESNQKILFYDGGGKSEKISATCTMCNQVILTDHVILTSNFIPCVLLKTPSP